MADVQEAAHGVTLTLLRRTPSSQQMRIEIVQNEEPEQRHTCIPLSHIKSMTLLQTGPYTSLHINHTSITFLNPMTARTVQETIRDHL